MTSRQYNPGDMFSPRYKIVSHLGAGSFADVYLAEQTDVGRQVALKVLKQSVLQRDPEQSKGILARFEQEARVISNLRDSHTVTLYDYGHHGKEYFMACEYIEGKSLGEILSTQGNMAPSRVVTILRQLLRSLQEAHAYGIIHRDVKPDNIFIYDHMGQKDRARLLDFGIAKFIDQDVDLTMDGTFVGTPRYAAPERIQSLPLKPSSDIYSLGLVAYEMLTGIKPFQGQDTMTTLRNQVLGPSLTLPDYEPFPQSLRDVIDRMINKDQAARYQLSEPIMQDLDRWDQQGKEDAAATVRLEAITANKLILADQQRKQHGAQRPIIVEGPTMERPQVTHRTSHVVPVSLEEMSEPNAQTIMNMDAGEVARQLAQARAPYVSTETAQVALLPDTQDFTAADMLTQTLNHMPSPGHDTVNVSGFQPQNAPQAANAPRGFSQPGLIQQDHSWTQQASHGSMQSRTKGHDPNLNTIPPGSNQFAPTQPATNDNSKKLLIAIFVGLALVLVVFAVIILVLLRLYVFKG